MVCNSLSLKQKKDMESTYKISLPKQDLTTTDAAAKAILEGSMKNYGMIANLTANMVNHPGLAQTYNTGYAALHAGGDLTPAECDVIFMTVSRENNCSYCVAGHSMSGDFMTNVPKEVTQAIRNNTDVPDKKLAALVEFTRIMVKSHGNPTDAQVKSFLAAGYSEKSILSVILGIAVKTISNYTNHIFHTEVDQAFASHAWEPKNN